MQFFLQKASTKFLLLLALVSQVASASSSTVDLGGGGIPPSQKGAPFGVAPLDAAGLVPAANLPSGGGGGVSVVTGMAPVSSSGGTTPAISMAASTNAVDGYLTAADHIIFSAKESTLSFVAPLSRLVNSISCVVATGSVAGCISAADWTTFNSKEPGIAAGTTLQFWRGDKSFQTLDTLAVAENTSLYFTNARARSALSATSPQLYNSGTGVLSIQLADSTHDGYLIQGDWNTFNGKQNALGFTPENVANKDIDGTLAANSDTKYPSQKAVKTYADTKQPLLTPGSISTTTSGVSIPAGANSTVGPNVAIDIATADATHNGLLSQANWSTFNSKEPAIASDLTTKYWRGDKSFQLLDTSVVPENGNLYYTSTRFNTALATKSTTDLAEGTNLYYTNARGIGSLLTGYVAAAGSVTSADSLLIALQKLDGNIQANSATIATNTTAIATKQQGPLTGDVTTPSVTNPAATIQPNVVTNAKLAQMAANSFKANNTGAAANAADITGAQATAMLSPMGANTFTSAGTQGVVPAPPAGTIENGNFLTGSGFAPVDQSKPRFAPFSLSAKAAQPALAGVKFLDAIISGNYAYVSASNISTVNIYNISNPAKPRLVSNLVGSLAGTYRFCMVGSTLYVPSSGGSTLFAVNVSDPTTPVVSGSLAITGAPGSLYNCVAFVAADTHTYVAMATQSKGLTIVDATTPAAMTQVYQEGVVKSFGIALDPNGTTLYTTVYQTTTPWTNRFFKTWDVTTPGTPTLQNTYTLPANTKPNGITIAGAFAYVTDTNGSLINILDITTKTAPVFDASVAPSGTFGSGFTAQISGNYMYVPSGSNATDGGYIDMWDITTKTAPIKIATVKTGVPNSVFGGIVINNGYIYAADYGIAGGSAGSLDVFTMPFESMIAGSSLASTYEAKNYVQVDGSTSGNIKLSAGTTPTAHTVTMPPTVCAAGQYWTDNGFGVMACATAGAAYSRAVSTVAVNTTVATLTTDNIVNVNTSGGGVTITMPDATASNSWCLSLKQLGANAVTVTPAGANTIDGNAGDSISGPNNSYKYCAIGGQWFKY